MPGYGKHFESMYTGTMFGSGSDVFAVWGYVISHCRKGEVELNQKVLAATIGMSVQEAEDAVAFLCEPDPNSRSQLDEGRRLVKTGSFTYRVPTFEKYNVTHSDDEVRAFERERKQKYRNSLKTNVPDSPGQNGTVPDSPGQNGTVPDSPGQNGTVPDMSRMSHTPAPAPAPASKKLEGERTTPARKRAVSIPTDFTLTPERLLEARKRRVGDPELEFEKFRAHHEAHGKVMKSWDAAWRTWCLNVKKFRGNEPPRGAGSMGGVLR